MSARLAQRVLLVGWDAADWKLIHPLMDAGQMPTLARLVEEGVMGDLASLDPMYSPTVWTSIVTGKRPRKHGVLWFTEPTPAGDGARPVQSTTRRCKALWNILGQSGMSSHAVGWWASHPAEPISGICVTNEYARCRPRTPSLGPLPSGTIHPASLQRTFEELRISAEEIDPAILRAFVPHAERVDQARDDRLAVLAACLAESFTTHNAITWILENRDWDLAAVFFDTIDHLSHGFMPFHPPRLEHVTQEDFELYHHVVAAGYRLHDLLLARLLDLAGDDVTVLLVSDHGFHSDHLRTPGIPRVPAGPAVCHRRSGVLVMHGAHVRRDERIEGASVLDVTPTILGLLGLPIGADMDGRFLVEALEGPAGRAVERIPSWEDVPGDDGMHAPGRREDPYEASELLSRMQALGYVEADGEAGEQAAVAVREARLSLARDFLDADMPREALPVLEELARRHPDEHSVLIALAGCHLRLGRREDAARALTRLESAPGDDSSEIDALVLGAAIGMAEGRPAVAVEALSLALSQAHPSRRARLLAGIGHARLALGQWQAARDAFAEAAAIDPDLARAHVGLTVTALRLRLDREAVEHALRTVVLLPQHAAAHHRLGTALVRVGELGAALRAFDTALAHDPGLRAAARFAARLRALGATRAESTLARE